MSEGRGQPLRGRADECADLSRLVSDARSGTSGVLVLRGEAGVGKSALLDYTAEVATGFRVVHVAGVEADMELAFAALQQLCAPILNHLEALPVPQREALDVAFGLRAGPVPDRFLVGLAVLSLIAAAAEERPLLCVVDDAQWLDQVSVQTLGFVARRLLADPVVLLFAVRDRADVLSGLPDLTVGGLADADARDLLESVMIGGVDPLVRDRIVTETRGIPLAIVEVPNSVSAAELAGGFWIAGKRSSSSAIEGDFGRRIEALPEDTRRLLLIAAAEPLGDAALFARAADRLGIAIEALTPAEAAGFIEFGARMSFRHPLMRSAVYRTADIVDRRAAHRALAEATDGSIDPDRRAWHCAHAASGPDDSVAAQLEASAERAQSRGGVAAAAAFLERATLLTADPAARGARAIVAAEAKREAAAPEAARDLLAIADAAPLTDLQRARVARIRAQAVFADSRSGAPGAVSTARAAAQLLDAARGLDGIDDDLARETYLEALAAAMYAGRLGEPNLIPDVATSGRAAVTRMTGPPRPVDYLLRGLTTRIVDGPNTGSDDLRSALELWTTLGQKGDGKDRHWPFPIAQESAAHELWDGSLLQRLAVDMVTRARDTGALAMLPQALTYRAGVHVYTGELATAARLLEEAEAITSSIGRAPRKYHTLTLAAWRGVPDDAVGLIAAAAADGAAKGEGRLLGLSNYAAAALYNGLGRYEEAYAAAKECCAYEDLGFYGWCLFELVEAAVHLGDRDSAIPALRQFEIRASGSESDWGLGGAAWGRALLAEDDDADALFAEAVLRLDRAGISLHLARARLSYGEWLRRALRKTDAREQLSIAHGMFTTMGAVAFAERTRRELAATGEKVRKQATAAGDGLTPQESQIARLAADGLTNQEIGAQMFISTHTVEWHLRKVFAKLAITSRRQLRNVALT